MMCCPDMQHIGGLSCCKMVLNWLYIIWYRDHEHLIWRQNVSQHPKLWLTSGVPVWSGLSTTSKWFWMLEGNTHTFVRLVHQSQRSKVTLSISTWEWGYAFQRDSQPRLIQTRHGTLVIVIKQRKLLTNSLYLACWDESSSDTQTLACQQQHVTAAVSQRR